MFRIKNGSEVYHIFDFEVNAYLQVYISFDQLIQFLHQFQMDNYHHSMSTYGNEILDNLNLTMKDMSSNYCCFEKRIPTLKRYIIIDNYERIVDIRPHYDKIVSYQKPKVDNLHNNYLNRMRNKIGNGYNGAIFRKEPIPLLRGKHYTRFRRVKTTNERKQNSDCEVHKYIRGKRMPMNLPTSYDSYRHNDISWKTQTKHKKQWMKNLR